MSYTPKAGELDAKVVAYFARHRGEELSAADIALKFDCPANLVEPSLSSAITSRTLERYRGTARAWTYRAGPRIGDVSTEAVKQAAAATAGRAPFTLSAARFPTAPAAPRKTRRTLPAPLADKALQAVEKDVPLPPDGRRGPKRTNWALLFERLAQPGLCSSPLPIEHIGAAKAATKKHGKEAQRNYTVAAINDTHFRIWRTA